MKVKLSDAFDLQMGKTPPRNDRECWGDGHKWISISDIGNAGKYIDTTKEEITVEFDSDKDTNTILEQDET